jgi:uncharacterized membrane protein
LILLIAVLWCAAILIAPLWAGNQGIAGSISGFIYAAFSKACHQQDDRSLHAFGHKLGVCARCTLIYFGFLLGTIVYPFVRKLNSDLPPVWILLAGAALVALDAGLDTFDIIRNTFLSREITGGILGIILSFYLVPGTVKLFDEFFESRKIIKDETNAASSK